MAGGSSLVMSGRHPTSSEVIAPADALWRRRRGHGSRFSRGARSTKSSADAANRNAVMSSQRPR